VAIAVTDSRIIWRLAFRGPSAFGGVHSHCRAYTCGVRSATRKFSPAQIQTGVLPPLAPQDPDPEARGSCAGCEV